MLKYLLKDKSQASVEKGGMVQYGYSQLEPNHLSAQRTGQIYAQLPAAANIGILEQGQFVKYDYAAKDDEGNPTGGLVTFNTDHDNSGEWMLVYNETKLYREGQLDCEFAMIKENYQARVYSPINGEAQEMYGPTRLLQGKREYWDAENQQFVTLNDFKPTDENGEEVNLGDYSVASKAWDYHEMNDPNFYADGNLGYTDDNDPRSRLFMKLREAKEKMMPEGTSMVPRVFKTNVGDIFTTNLIMDSYDSVEVGTTILSPDSNGILSTSGDGSMSWQVVKKYTVPDGQPGVKVMRIK